ncbi:glycoside hydrolase family 18 protein [Metarhizium album ARSEF 1941]|uniref:chitinase n=1 Tax=Metarhizium album (strain ARSEF 1941) TaxID=1081103 RepID=A0A0B2X684_METAS|nr:glycoside hydrolase family 18 protein [Metarhizium album ARSEF 1941]KHO00990.1 glycoside hydrolase family 18 protein [Metarhizium album ARSEF 1941]
MAAAIAFLVGINAVQAALNIDGTQATGPVGDVDPSPTGDVDAYDPDNYDCPLPCNDYANPHSWIPYLSVERLERCKSPMLLQFSVAQLLDDPKSTVLIRSCSLASGLPSRQAASAMNAVVPNPKKGDNLFQPSLGTAAACFFNGTQSKGKLNMASTTEFVEAGAGRQAADLLRLMQSYFREKDNCDESIIFGRHHKTVAGIYIGASLGKKTAESSLHVLADHLRSSSNVSSHTTAELCSGKMQPENSFGISVDVTGNLAAVQRAVLAWSKGTCASSNKALRPTGMAAPVGVWQIAATSWTGNVSSPTTNLGPLRSKQGKTLGRRATCRHVRVVSGDGCAALVSRCGISTAEFSKYNPRPNLCSSLMPGDHVCCSPGEAYTEPKPEPPKANSDGTCAVHLIHDSDTCDKIARKHGVTVADLEKWNKGKIWAWTECKDMLVGYNMCISDGSAPMPPPQRGTQCGPLVPGTKPPRDKSTSIADLNPCPLKACCSNWGFCGVFPAHCQVHKPNGGGPGSKKRGYQNTCVSNCGTEIKRNSGPPAAFQRIGYYEAFGMKRDCLRLRAKDANTDGTYTHIHWGFADIDPVTWKPVINEGKDQWEDFKKLPNIKRILSLGGWAYSTEPATYNIIRRAIIDNRATFANNLAQFVQDEGIDGIDIDWEYPGAPDILVGGQPIGQPSDGVNYLKFLTVLKSRMGTAKSVSIAAPASYWYLKAFPIDRIASVVDYIVYMTYDLHGQWDAGNPNAFDECPSGRCIRSHVNLTETANALVMITKAGVPNNKIFVGEASYGRSFRMAKDGCWGPMCDFTGSRAESNASPGRCTKTAGYLAYAEINEIIKAGGDVQTFHDGGSNTDVLLYNGDYVSYTTPTTRETRRTDWEKLNFAGTIDWAVDLQRFSADDMSSIDRPQSGQGCVSGRDLSLETAEMCEFACEYGFCPASLCSCVERGKLRDLPPEKKDVKGSAWDSFDLDMNRLCAFSCKYDKCPEDVCSNGVQQQDEDEDDDDDDDAYEITPGSTSQYETRYEHHKECHVFEEGSLRQSSVNQCIGPCSEEIRKAKEEGRVTNYGCMGFFPLNEPIPWFKVNGFSSRMAPGRCVCDDMLVNTIAESVIEAMPMIAAAACFMLMSAVKLVLDVGASFIPGVGKAIDAGLNMATTAAQMAAYIYPEEEDPAGAFKWWLSPCGGESDLVPDDIKQAFDILSTVSDGVTGFRPPKKIKKGSGKKNDDGNPTNQDKPRALKRPAVNSGGNTGGGGSGNSNNKKQKTTCKIRKGYSTRRIGGYGNTVQFRSCVQDKTVTDNLVIESVHYDTNAKALGVTKECPKEFTQACYHYSSAIRVSPQWATITCPPEAGKPRWRKNAKATNAWAAQHDGKGWKDEAHRAETKCDKDEYPPAYFLNEQDDAWKWAGKPAGNGQLVRWVPWKENQDAGQLWKGACFEGPVRSISDTDLVRRVRNAPAQKQSAVTNGQETVTYAEVTVAHRPEWGMKFAHAANPLPNDGLDENPCWPSKIAPRDPGFALLTFDPYYTSIYGKDQAKSKHPYAYDQPYNPPTNGA